MIYKKYLSHVSSVMQTNFLLKIVVYIIGGVTLINSYMIYYSLKHQTVILIPPELNAKAEIKGDYVSEEYVKSFARYITWMVYSYNPSSIRKQLDEVLGLFEPESFSAAKKTFYTLSDQVETSLVSSNFYIQSIWVDKSKNIIQVKGLNTKFSQDGKKIEETFKTVEITYSVRDGRFYVRSISESETR